MNQAQRIVAAAAVLLIALAGCTTGGGSPVPGGSGSLRYALATEPDCLDPHVSSKLAVEELARPVLDSLVATDPKGTIHPWLAKSWTTSPDGKTYRFELRPGVRFSDGTPFTAAAVKANLEHIVAPSTKSLAAAASIAPFYAETRVLDEHAVELRLTKPDASLLTVLSSASFGMELPATLTGDQAGVCARIVGTGPFVQDEPWTGGRRITYRKNPGYDWAPETAAHRGPPRLDTLEVDFLVQDQVRLGALTSGQVDVIDSVPVAGVAQLRRTGGIAVDLDVVPGQNYSYFPNTAAGPFADQRVREAFRDGIDWQTIVTKLTFGVYQQAKGPISPATPLYDPAVERLWSYDRGKAAALLDQAGYTARDADGYRARGGQRLTVRWRVPQGAAGQLNKTVGQQAQEAAKELGIDLDIVEVPLGEAITDLKSGNYDLRDGSFVTGDPDVLRRMFAKANIPSAAAIGGNVARYGNDAVDRDLAAALVGGDPAERARLYGRVQTQVVGDAAVFPVYTVTSVLARASGVSGIAMQPDGYPGFYDAWVGR